MPMLRHVLVLALLASDADATEIVVHMPPVGFRFTTQNDMAFTSTSGTTSKAHAVFHREIVASDGTVIETQGIGGPGNESAISSKTTYRLFFLTDIETTARPAPDQPPVTNGSAWDCPPDGLDHFYPRGTVAQVSLACEFTAKAGGQAIGPHPVTVSFSDLGEARDTTPAGTFDVRKILVSYGAEGVTSETTYDFAPALGISVVQETKISTPRGKTVTHAEVTEFTPAR